MEIVSFPVLIKKKRFNRNLYIPDIIFAGLCYTMPLSIPSGLPSTYPSVTVLNLQEKAYTEDWDFKKKWNLLSMQLIYDHQQQEQIKLLNELESVPSCFHKLPFHSWIHHNTPVNALTKKAHKMIWHQQLIHLSLQTIKEAYKYVVAFQTFLVLTLMM